jgi:branched-chain amino acid transport system ATP-binding protein
MSAPRLVCTDVTVKYGSMTAVDEVSLELQRGQVYGLLGPNGAGKSSLFKAITGRMLPISGHLAVDGRDVTSMVTHRRVREGIVGTYQTPRPFANLSVEDNVALGARVRRLSDQDLRQIVDRSLSQVGLTHRSRARGIDLTIYEMRLLERFRPCSKWFARLPRPESPS